MSEDMQMIWNGSHWVGRMQNKMKVLAAVGNVDKCNIKESAEVDWDQIAHIQEQKKNTQAN